MFDFHFGFFCDDILILSYLGTQSPDAVNKLLRLSDSSQIKPRGLQKSKL